MNYLHKDANDDDFVLYQVDKVVDTTGAGDAFVGSLAYLIASNKDIPLEQVNYLITKRLQLFLSKICMYL